MATAPSADSMSIVEQMQEQLARLRERIFEPGPLSMGERTAMAQHASVIAGSLRVLHSTLLRVASDESNHAPV